MRVELLSGDAVWLDVPAAADIDEITRLCRHSSISEWTSMPVPYLRTDASDFVGDAVPAGWAARSPTWALRSARDADLIGMIGLVEVNELTAEIGFWLAPAQRKRGRMTAAVQLVCEFALHPTGMALHRVEWRAFVGNHASAAVARRAGFRYEGLLRGGAVQRGRLRDCWVAGRLIGDPPGAARDWPPGI